MLYGPQEFFFGVGPVKRMSVKPVPEADETKHFMLEVIGTGEITAFEAFSFQDTEPDLHLIEPRAMERGEVEDDSALFGLQPSFDLLSLMGVKVIQDDVDLLFISQGIDQSVHKDDKSGSFAININSGKDLSGGYHKSGHEASGAMAGVFKFPSFNLAGPHGKSWMFSLQGLNPCKFIETDEVKSFRVLSMLVIKAENI